MRLSSIAIFAVPFASAAILSVVAASFAVTGIERSTEIAVREVLDETDHGWAEVTADGLQVVLSGIAPDEADRFTAISQVGSVVDAVRIIDRMQVAPSMNLAAPEFSVEILRNDSGISLIGLIPQNTDRDALLRQLRGIKGSGMVTDLLETADYPVPRGWIDALSFAVLALDTLPRSKISVVSGQVAVTAISDSAEEKSALTQRLNRAAPPGLRLSLNIAAPRPVITPFTLRFLIDDAGGRFDACSAQDDDARDRILSAARDAGLASPATCVVGMGVPSPHWPTAAEQSIAALAELGKGSVTLSNADITLIADENTDGATFERVVGELETALPEVFALHAILTPKPTSEEVAGTPEFIATLSPEGQVQLRGRVNDAHLRKMAESYAKARFGADAVYTAARVVQDLPPEWPVRVLTGLEALSHLVNGSVTVTPDTLVLRGVSHFEDTSAKLSQLLSNKLGEGASFDLAVTFRAPPEPKDKPPEPGECEARIAEIQAENKIAFEPGSATVAGSSHDTIVAIADVLKLCGPVRMEIQGHTDSQGRESMNLELSQARANSVLNELRARRVRTPNLTAVGYGEDRPIQPNDSEEGREANRRIEFWLVRPAPTTPEQESTLDSAAAAEGVQEQPVSDASDATDPAAEETGETDTEAQEAENGQN